MSKYNLCASVCVKKKTTKPQDDNMLPEYDLTEKKGVRRKYVKALQAGYSVRVVHEDGTITMRHFVPKESAILLDKDVKAHFPDSKSVNAALRSLIRKRAKVVVEKQKKVRSIAAKARRSK